MRVLLRIALVAILALTSPSLAQEYAEDAAVPPDAKGEVLELRGEVLELRGQASGLKGEVLELRGFASGLAGKADPLQTALKELGAEVTGKEIKIDLGADVLFDFDKAKIRKEARPALEKVLQVLLAYPKASVTIDGHTDAKGSDKYNQKLSERRAKAVRDYLATAGATTRISARGFGETSPVAPNTNEDGSDNPEGRQRNRRVQITVKTE